MLLILLLWTTGLPPDTTADQVARTTSEQASRTVSGRTASGGQQEKVFQKALRYERQGNLTEALRIYLDLMGSPESRPRAYEQAVRVTASLERWPDLEALVSTKLGEDPEDVESRLHLGRSLAHQGRHSDARREWKRAVEAAPGRADVAERVGRYALGAGMLDDAISSFLEVRRMHGVQGLFAPEVANLHLRQNRVGSAIEEYLVWLESAPRQGLAVEGELRKLLWNPDVRDEAKDILAGAVEDQPQWTDLNRMVVNLWIEVGWCEEALELASGAVKPESGAALSLVWLGDQFREQGCTREAIRSYRRGTEGTPGDRKMALVRLGHLFMDLGREADAVVEFERFLEEFRGAADTPDVLYTLGQALLRTGRAEEGLRRLRVLVRDYPQNPKRTEAQFLAAECLIGLGRLEDAAGELESLFVEDLGSGGEELLYRRGEILFLAGRFDEAMEDYGAVIAGYPKGRYVNDALSRVLLVAENRIAGDDVLILFSSAIYFKRLGQWPQAAAQLDSLVERFPEGSLIEEALLVRAEVERDSGDPRGAVRSLDRLMDGRPDSRLVPRALVMKGDLYLEDLDDAPAARQAYETTLMQYPDCPLADGVRRKLRAIEEALP